MGWQASASGQTTTYTVAATAADRAMVERVAAEAGGLDDTVAVEVGDVRDDAAARAAVTDGEADAWLHRADDGWVLTTDREERLADRRRPAGRAAGCAGAAGERARDDGRAAGGGRGRDDHAAHRRRGAGRPRRRHRVRLRVPLLHRDAHLRDHARQQRRRGEAVADRRGSHRDVDPGAPAARRQDRRQQQARGRADGALRRRRPPRAVADAVLRARPGRQRPGRLVPRLLRRGVRGARGALGGGRGARVQGPRRSRARRRR